MTSFVKSVFASSILPANTASPQQNQQVLDFFLSRGKGDVLARNRLLGVTHGIKELVDQDRFDSEKLFDGIDIKNPDPCRLEPVLKRFFFNKNVKFLSAFSYCDNDEPEGKWNVKGIQVEVEGNKKTCFLKYMDEGWRRECLGMRINNILTDAPVPFMAEGALCLQLGITGPNFGFLPDIHSVTAKRKYNFELGKAQEYAQLTALGDRRPPNLIYGESHVQHIDFGAAFSRTDSLRRYLEPGHEDAYEAGRKAAKKIIFARLTRNYTILASLLCLINEETLDAMRAENTRGDFPIHDPVELLRKYIMEF